MANFVLIVICAILLMKGFVDAECCNNITKSCKDEFVDRLKRVCHFKSNLYHPKTLNDCQATLPDSCCEVGCTDCQIIACFCHP